MRTGLKVCRNCERVYRCEDDYLTMTSRWRLGQKEMLYFNCSCDSTLVIPKGAYDWYSPEKFLSPQAYRVFNELALGRGIPKVAEAIGHVLGIVDDLNKGVSNIVSALKHDPILASDVLKLANLSRLSEKSEIRSLEHAITYVGRKALKDLILVAALRKFEFKCSDFKGNIFWREALLAGVVGEHIMRKLSPGLQTADEVYLSCALANIGKVIAATAIPNSIDAVFSYCKKNEANWAEAERNLASPNHELLGEIACIFWALPIYVMRATVNHHGKEAFDLETKFRPAMCIVTFANQATHWLLGQPYRLDCELLKSSYLALGLPDDMDEFLDTLKWLRDKALLLLSA